MQLSPQYLIFSRKLPKRICKLLYDVAAKILQKPKNVVLAFMHILLYCTSEKNVCKTALVGCVIISLTWLHCSVCSILAAAVCLHGCKVCIFWVWLAIHGCSSECSIVAAVVCLQGCSVCIDWLLLALHGCTVVYAVLWLLPFAW
jgi:hypothetical protein